MAEHLLVGLEVDEVSAVDAAANGRTFLVMKRAAQPDEDGMENETVVKLTQEVAELRDELTKAKDTMCPDCPKRDQPEEDIEKSLPEALRKELAAGREAAEALAKARYDAIAEPLTGLGDNRGETLRAIAKGLAPEAFDAFVATLTALQTQADAGLDTEVGTVGEGTGDLTSEMEKKARAYMQENPNMKYSEAMRKALREVPQD